MCPLALSRNPVADMSDSEETRRRPVSTAEVAAELGMSERQTRRILEKCERMGMVKRVGERGGWLPSKPAPIDLYAAAGIPRPEVRDQIPT